ncbi:ketopantoate reductase PanE/ApbA C terminal-domain-containing protein [Pisolithus marmoratus]|nr:ketopantoate reductase PanE/ApbA C terminal-domain-containing protein [Pisolithus marmoratus]
MGFYVLGLGAIGTLLAYHLRAALPPSQSVTLIHKSFKNAWAAHRRCKGVLSMETSGVIQKCGGFHIEVLEKHERPGAGVAFNPSLARDQMRNHVPVADDIHTDPIKAVFVTARTIKTTELLSQLLPRLNASSTVVLLQNGMGVFEELVQQVFRNPETRPNFILASNTNGAWLKGTGHVVYAEHGTLEFGIVSDPRRRDFEASLIDETKPKFERHLNLDDITHPGDSAHHQYHGLRETVAALNSLHALGAKWCPIADVQNAMRRKLVVDAVIEPLTALMGCRNGALFRDRGSANILQNICKEASELFRAQLEKETESWLDALGPDVDSSRIPVGRMPLELEAEHLSEQVRQAVRRRGNISTMLFDITHGRPTEIQYLNGYLVGLGKQLGIPTPVNTILCDLVRMRRAVPVDQRL